VAAAANIAPADWMNAADQSHLAEECAAAAQSSATWRGDGEAPVEAKKGAGEGMEHDLRDHYRAAAERSRSGFAENAVTSLALTIDAALRTGRLQRGDLEAIIRRLTLAAFARRVDRSRCYLGDVNAADNDRRIADVVTAFAYENGEKLPFDRFRRLVERPAFGIVFTAHPTFSLDADLSRVLAELIAGADPAGKPLNESAIADLLRRAALSSHRPPAGLTLAVEHRWSIEALENAGAAVDRLNRTVLEAARALYPDGWTELTPCLVTLASWVGYDLDGRADISWRDTLEKRLLVKAAQLTRWERAAAEAMRRADGDRDAIQRLGARIAEARRTTQAQCAALALLHADSAAADVAGFSRLAVAEAEAALTSTSELRGLIDAALAAAGNDELKLTLLTLRANMAGLGLGLAHTHVRLNANQVHNSIRSRVGLHGSPSDPTRRRSYVNAVSDLIAGASEQSIGYASVLAERASARRLFMLVAQMLKHVDGETRIRFLIAETESGFTLLAALYFARLFGIEDRIEISPLFETHHALEHGDRVIDEALRNAAFRAYVERIGRLAIQFGFSDSGRYLGQMAATFLIERLRLRIAAMLERHRLTHIELVLFNTHGESIGRGAHPASFADRLLYLCPPASAAAFRRIGVSIKEEVSLQGGDGYLWFMHPATALAVVRTLLEHRARSAQEEAGDPIYAESDFAAEFFNAAEHSFARLVADPDYAALLGIFRTNLIEPTGSRPTKRESDDGGAAAELTHPSQLRAIPNNAVLQQLGFIANVVGGLGGASALDPETFAALCDASPRFRRALDMAVYALSLGDHDWLAAYFTIFDPGFWLRCAALASRDGDRPRRDECRSLARRLEELGVHERLSRVHRILHEDLILLRDNLALAPAIAGSEIGIGAAAREDLAILHAIRIALIQQIWSLAMRAPEFSPQLGTSVADLIRRLLHLEVDIVAARLKEIFPLSAVAHEAGADFGEAANYFADSQRTYAGEHRDIFDPMLELFGLVRQVSAAVTHICGAVG
jgi:phosphoenolpyruvate carboxylase